ncbi:PLD nuclease N-terminal domain-containing protein [Candidatus Parcubacteria bacterium]|nr:PLD nuclease N-terminal domain-containing protein [Candidatus Parcubacteria bacterium]
MDLIAAVNEATCKLNGQVVPCEQLTGVLKTVFGWGAGVFAVFILISLLTTVFWIMMLVHAIKHPIEHKPLWILVMIFAGVLGAIIYYFAVKRQPMPTTSSPTASV